jgi:hypothetical protein
MTHDLETRKNPTRLNVGLKKNADLKLEPTDAENQDAKTLRERFDDLCHQFNHDDLDPVARVIKLAEIKRVREAIKTVERVAHAK